MTQIPISIGAHRNNDVQLNDERLGAMHCRLNLTDKGIVIAAATSAGVNVNGSLTKKTVLTENDEVTIGDTKLTVYGKAAAGGNKAASSVDLKPVTRDDLFDDLDSPDPEDQVKTTKSSKPPKKKKKSPPPQETAVSAILDDDDFLEDDDPFAPADTYSSARDPGEFDDDEEDLDEEDMLDDEQTDSAESSKESIRERMQARRYQRAVRPGEEELLRSKVLQFLGGGTIVLLILAAIFYVLFLSNDSQQMYDQALTLYEEGKFSQAIVAFEGFLKKYPNINELSDDAHLKLGQSKIEKEISGSAGNWQAGLVQLENFARENQGTKGFLTEQRDNLREYAKTIFEGAIGSASSLKQREFLGIAEEARKKVRAYGPLDEGEMKALEKKMEEQYEKAKSIVLKREVFDDYVAKIKKALEAKQPLAALQKRRELLVRYKDFENDKQLAAILGQILSTEKELITTSELNKEALVEERERTVPSPSTIAVHTRSQTAGQSEGEVILIQTENSCYGIDTITGQPVWQYLTGPQKSFFPVQIETAPEGVLMFDSLHHEMVAIELNTGKLMWRQPLLTQENIPEQVTGKPLVFDASIFIATDQNNLYQLDLSTGRLLVRLHFAQPLFGSPALTADERHCLIAGEQELFYYFSLRPLKCEAVAYFGHLPGDIDIPIISMGSLALITQNTGADQCSLKILRTEYPENPEEFPSIIKPEAEQTIAGRVINPPFLRGKQLVVHSTGKRLTSFTVSADTGTQTLTEDGTFQFQESQETTPPEGSQTDDEGNVYLYIGPNGQMWMTLDALRKLQINSDHFQLNPKETAAGTAVQPLQMQHEKVFVGRSHPFSPAVFLSQADRQSLDSFWRTICGAKVIGTTENNGESLVCLTDAGSVLRIQKQDLENKRFLTESINRIPLDQEQNVADSPARCITLNNGYMFVAWGQANPFYSLVSRTGQVTPPLKLPASVEADPIEIEAGIVLPLAEHLVLIPNGSSSRQVVNDFQTVDARWKSLIPLSGNEFLGLTDAGYLARYEFSSANPSHFREVSHYDLRNRVDVEPVIVGDTLYLATADGAVQVIDTRSLTITSTINLPAPASSDLWIAGETLLVQSDGKLWGYAVGGGGDSLWNQPLSGGAIAVEPTVRGNVAFTSDLSGRILKIDLQQGTLTELGKVDIPLSLPLFAFGGEVLGATLDGSLYRLTNLFSP
ncbi:MAG: PQQ-binding-like beta-propeller repeat protein [Planctomycetaceae bacterium]|nr:PQQ-binding-like beta-propeller repeat protein [Planctomycetaceae bacterium]